MPQSLVDVLFEVAEDLVWLGFSVDFFQLVPALLEIQKNRRGAFVIFRDALCDDVGAVERAFVKRPGADGTILWLFRGVIFCQ